MAAATTFDALDRSQPRASQCGYSLMNLWCGLSPLLARTYRQSHLLGTSGLVPASDIHLPMSALPRFSSASPPTPDVADPLRVRGVLTLSGLGATRHEFRRFSGRHQNQ